MAAGLHGAFTCCLFLVSHVMAAFHYLDVAAGRQQ
jgi:hypothetical protein